jgi:hypothetical protein
MLDKVWYIFLLTSTVFRYSKLKSDVKKWKKLKMICILESIKFSRR